MNRQKFQRRPFVLKDEAIRERLILVIQNLPIDTEYPLEIVIDERRPTRKLSQQAYLFAGPLKDIAEQAWVKGEDGKSRQFPVKIWAHHCKEMFLPERFDPELCKDGYVKWHYTPAGERVLIGSTTELTVKGMVRYTEELTAMGANLGVSYTAREDL